MTPPSQTSTRDQLLDAAEKLVNEQGFAATSVDKIIGQVKLTKGAFFHHFKNRNQLAKALIDRHAATDQELMQSTLERAKKLSSDPLQRMLIFVGLLIEVAEQLDQTSDPCCLFATYSFESGLFDTETQAVISDCLGAWQATMESLLRAAAKANQPVFKVDIKSLALMMMALFEGSYVLARTFPGRQVFAKQIRHYRNYLKLVFDAKD